MSETTYMNAVHSTLSITGGEVRRMDAAFREMTRLVKPGGHLAVIDLEGNDDPILNAFNHDIEMLLDPTHVRS